MRRLLLPLLLVVAAGLAADQPGKVYTVATSHLDTQWRWTIQETIAKYLLDTLDDNFDLLERYPDYVFNFEGAFRYQLIKEYYPERYERMKEYIAQGRWRVCGSWLDAVDVNMPSPEALYRHALYGNGFFEREFGTRSVDVFLPDCFGFGYALPSIMAHSGLTGFSTQKLTWGSAYGIPFDLGRWRGVDGSEVIAAVNPGAYVSDLEADVSRDSTVIAAVERTVAAGGPPYAFKYYGTGDTGGAPDESSVQWLQKSIASDGPVEVVSAGADQIFRELTDEQIAALPVYDGELVMTSHGAGCYTSQAAMKRWNRRCEVLGDAAERAAALAWWLGGQPYPGEELERAWTRFLWHGFHDDLTGTSIPEAYAFSWNDMLLSQQEFAQVLRTSLGSVASGLDTDVDGTPVVVFNPLGFPRTEMVVYEMPDLPSPYPLSEPMQLDGPDGRPVPTMMLEPLSGLTQGATRLVAFLATVPANGVAVYSFRPMSGPLSKAAPVGWDPAAGVLDTERYRLRLSEAGLVSLFDEQTGCELLSAPPRLQLLRNEPAKWAAWEIDYDDLMAAPYAEVPLGGVPETVVAGPGLARLTFTHEAAGSVFRQTLLVRGDRLDWELDIDWATEATLLKAAFFTTARDTAVTYDLGLGTIRRGLNRPQLYEVPAQRWADLTDQSSAFGLAILNDGRHGWDHPDPGTLRLTLLHTPAVNDRWRWIEDQKSQDLGRHRLTVSMLGHGPNWRPEVVRAADALNQPLLVFTNFGSARIRHRGPWGRSLSLLHIAGDRPEVAVRAIKKSEQGDWLVVRLQEITGAPAADVTIAAAAPVVAVRELQADELPIATGGDVVLRDGLVTCDLAPYQPRTLALQLAPPPAIRPVPATRSTPVALPWNVDGISTREQPTDGDFDGTGASLPGHLIPAVIERDGVHFETGPREPGAANLLRCEGQTIDLPRTDGNVLCLLMCSVDGPRPAEFRTDSLALRTDAWVPDGRAFFGQWDSRIIGGDIVHDRAELVPAYTADAAIGWVVTHRHGPQGEQEPYVYTHFYVVDVPLPVRRWTPRAVILPDDPALVILAASVVARPACLYCFDRYLVDRPTCPSVSIEAERRTFIDSLTVSLHSPNAATVIEVARGGDPAVVYDGSPLIITDTTTLTVTARDGRRDHDMNTLRMVARGPFPEATTRTAVFTRLDPWPAAAALPARLVPGLAAAVYHGAWERLPDWSTLAPVEARVCETVRIPDGVPAQDVGLVLRGWLAVPATGVYRFWLTSDDGSRLWLDDHLVVGHDGLHGATAVWGEAPLAAGRHALVVEYFQHLGGSELKLEWSGPGFARQEVPASALQASAGELRRGC